MSRYTLDQAGRRSAFGYIQKPSYRSNINNENNIIVSATENSPAYFYLGGTMRAVTSDLNCNVGISGFGGLTSTVEANTAYYLYAVLSEGSIYLIGDRVPPTEFVGSYEDWTYVGSFATRESTATLTAFRAFCGVVICDDDIETEVHTGDVNWTVAIFESLPVTAQMAYFRCSTNGAGGAEDLVAINGTGTTLYYPLVAYSQVLNITNFNFGWVPIFTAKTLYLLTGDAAAQVAGILVGWQEAPWEYQ